MLTANSERKPVRLFIQIPCFNEAETLPGTLAQIPRSYEGVDEVRLLIIDDGSTDGTAEVARAHGVDHVVRFTRNRGLARGFMAGVDACLKLGADIIVNTDADNQYPGEWIAPLIKPILEGESDFVIGDRQVARVEDFSVTKKALQKLGSWVVRQASGTDIPDAVSGFRAISREAATRMFVVSDYTYTIETIIQAGNHRTAITSIPMETNRKTRESRLVRSIPDYVRRSIGTILRIYTMYKPLKVFMALSLLTLLPALFLAVRFVVAYVQEPNISRHVQSLILVAILVITSMQWAVFAMVADLIAANRKLLEQVLINQRQQPTPSQEAPSDAA
jgi:glycosyltransferase involved in cell wall biosynthesis